MLKIEFVAYLDQTVIQSDYDNHVLRVDLTKWTQLYQQQQRFILEDANHHYLSHQRWLMDKAKHDAQFNEATDRLVEEMLINEGLRRVPESAEDDVDYKAAFDECEAELGAEVAQWRNLARKIVRADNESWSNETRGAKVETIISEMAVLLGDEPRPDKARMSVPDEEPKDHIIRGYSETIGQVVYWTGFHWVLDRDYAKKFTRLDALELANSTNAMDNDAAINICAIKETE